MFLLFCDLDEQIFRNIKIISNFRIPSRFHKTSAGMFGSMEATRLNSFKII
jgi:hypothetical protein